MMNKKWKSWRINKQKNFLIDKELYSQFTQKRNFSEEEIIIFSKKNKVIPGIVVSFYNMIN